MSPARSAKPVRSQPPLAEVLKQRALALDGTLIRRLRGANRLSLRLLHDVRLATKRQRAWWRLMVPLAGKAALRNADRRLNAAARLLGPMRDAQVMRRILGRLARQAGRKSLQAALDRGAQQLPAGAPPAAPAPAFPALRDQLVRALTSDGAAWRRLPAGQATDHLLVDQMVDAYRRARRRCRRAARRTDAKDLHSWRKWVKIHLIQLEFLQAERTRALSGQIRELTRLGRLLGRCQDLAVLDGWYDWRESSGAVGRKEARRMHTFLDGRRKALRNRCERLGRRLLADKPKAFAAKLRRVARLPTAAA